MDIPDFLKEQYPDEMTIIIQHQYWALKVKEDYFEVTLTFKKLPAPLHIPFDALTAFFDPGVQFGLQFREGDRRQEAGTGPVMVPAKDAAAPPPTHDRGQPGPKRPSRRMTSDKAEVVSLDFPQEMTLVAQRLRVNEAYPSKDPP